MAGNSLKKPKKLIVCCDGTWMNSDNGWVDGGLFEPGHLQTPSNVTRISRAILSEDTRSGEPHPQIVYYQAGVGTGFSVVDHIIGGGIGSGLSENIREAYAFLANNYTDDDSVFLIGFSRGAFTARSIGGLIGGIGLLTKDGLPYFYDVFKDWENTGVAGYKPRGPRSIPGFSLKSMPNDNVAYLKEYKAELKRLKLTRDIIIEAIGVWDTVGALGIPTTQWLRNIGFPDFFHEYKFLDTGIDNHVRNAFQALALDEKRASYGPTVWERPAGCKTKLKQVWFPGVHSNVGGSYEDAGIANITLAWMMSQLQPWIAFNPNYIRQQHALNEQYLTQQKQIKHRGWAMGKLYNSAVFPTSLGGSHTRTPNQYHKTDYGTGKQQPEMLHNTNELMHISVRIRKDEPTALGYDDAPKGYTPKALEHWNLQHDNDYHDNDTEGAASTRPGGKTRPIWKYTGTAAKGQVTEMLEDELGEYEIDLLKLDPKIAAKVLG